MDEMAIRGQSLTSDVAGVRVLDRLLLNALAGINISPKNLVRDRYGEEVRFSSYRQELAK
jgi:hypothetical protein